MGLLKQFYPSNKSGGNKVPGKYACVHLYTFRMLIFLIVFLFTKATIWFRYELNPITVKYKEFKQPVYHFLTTICAIVGGTFTVAGIVDSLLFTASNVFKKMQQGKLG